MNFVDLLRYNGQKCFWQMSLYKFVRFRIHFYLLPTTHPLLMRCFCLQKIFEISKTNL